MFQRSYLLLDCWLPLVISGDAPVERRDFTLGEEEGRAMEEEGHAGDKGTLRNFVLNLLYIIIHEN